MGHRRNPDPSQITDRPPRPRPYTTRKATDMAREPEPLGGWPDPKKPTEDWHTTIRIALLCATVIVVAAMLT